MTTGPCEDEGTDPAKVTRHDFLDYDTCEHVTLPGVGMIGAKLECATGVGVKLSIFQDKECTAKVRHVHFGKSNTCMLVTGAGHHASLAWNTNECNEGPRVQASETCQGKLHELAASKSEYTQNLYDCEEYDCPEIKEHNGVLDYGRLKKDCSCKIGYKNKNAAMEGCKDLPGGAKTCFVSYKVENEYEAKLDIADGMADCIPQSCLGTEDQAALTQQWTLSCLEMPGVSTCVATVSCQDPPTEPPSAPTEAPAATASTAERRRMSVMALCAAILLSRLVSF